MTNPNQASLFESTTPDLLDLIVSDAVTALDAIVAPPIGPAPYLEVKDEGALITWANEHLPAVLDTTPRLIDPADVALLTVLQAGFPQFLDETPQLKDGKTVSAAVMKHMTDTGETPAGCNYVDGKPKLIRKQVKASSGE